MIINNMTEIQETEIQELFFHLFLFRCKSRMPCRSTQYPLIVKNFIENDKKVNH